MHTHILLPHIRLGVAYVTVRGHQVEAAWCWQLYGPNEALMNDIIHRRIREKQSSPPPARASAGWDERKGTHRHTLATPQTSPPLHFSSRHQHLSPALQDSVPALRACSIVLHSSGNSAFDCSTNKPYHSLRLPFSFPYSWAEVLHYLKQIPSHFVVLSVEFQRCSGKCFGCSRPESSLFFAKLYGQMNSTSTFQWTICSRNDL